jgi:hypothetical protein
MIDAPNWFFPRLPLLCAALLLHAIAWTAIAWIMLSPARWTWLRVMGVLASFLALTIGEILLSSGVLLFEKPWPLLPVSTLWGWMILSALPNLDFNSLDRVNDLAVILATRVAAFCLSLMLLRLAGFRLRTRQTPDELDVDFRDKP